VPHRLSSATISRGACGRQESAVISALQCAVGHNHHQWLSYERRLLARAQSSTLIFRG
jgi:hypothetical protein